VKVLHARLVAAEDEVIVGAGSEPPLDAFAGAVVLVECDLVEPGAGEAQFLS
jgi:hypothetical protein